VIEEIELLAMANISVEIRIGLPTVIGDASKLSVELKPTTDIIVIMAVTTVTEAITTAATTMAPITTVSITTAAITTAAITMGAITMATSTRSIRGTRPA
jgi:hypothetical protein